MHCSLTDGWRDPQQPLRGLLYPLTCSPFPATPLSSDFHRRLGTAAVHSPAGSGCLRGLRGTEDPWAFNSKRCCRLPAFSRIAFCESCVSCALMPKLTAISLFPQVFSLILCGGVGWCGGYTCVSSHMCELWNRTDLSGHRSFYPYELLQEQSPLSLSLSICKMTIRGST